ncbi:Signal peptide peptidase [Fulvia fulva]|uniref:Signal peptide peptidase n=1 Tax=Passalora fulva TaxID=5499 RepID=A0A9Q8P492_PASFU|nr:Signal peptide peptidase [Fulvia fulva]KAK4636160.1 Signal peptide peptidase [Fulvia fulva]KAK4637950.1 Signal peptide peptidase [Fulvia fulva]UJO12571.1 Signal peptide peptidase [Fulvia fulva]WPV08548.1 Signal peptide peptidase [Fulvia fulva]WPV25166.1 Signal peptide peptidase [Fulvia fulva]
MTANNGYDTLLEAVAHHFDANRPLVPMYLHLLLSALFPIYIGAHASLSKPSSAAKRNKTSKDEADDDDDEEEETQVMEGLTPRDAIIFPVTAGIVLAGLYWLIKTYGASVINMVLGVYFSLVGTFSVAKLINDSWTTIESFISPAYYRDNGIVYKVLKGERKALQVFPAPQYGNARIRASPFAGPLGRLPLPGPFRKLAWSARDLTKQKFVVKGYLQGLIDFRAILTRHNILSTIIGIIAVGYSFYDKPWWLTNLQGFAVSYGALQLISPTTFATGTLILSGLFFYDIWAVFFTPLMVTVAKNLDVPIKLVFPRPAEPGAAPEDPPVRSYSMLGLGDIVLPGLMIALALRFDLYMYYLRQQKRRTVVARAGEGQNKAKETIDKAPYIPASGHWGDKFWTAVEASTPASAVLPAYLTTTFSRPYFYATMTGYVIGMIATLVFMSIFQHAQPALLYLVPGVLISLWGTGLVRGELRQMWDFTETLTGEEAESDSAKEETKADSKGFWSDLWAELFGTSEQKQTNKSGASSSLDATNTKKVPEAGDASNEKATTVSKDTVFSFVVTRHKRTATSIPKTDDSRESTDSIADDAVLVSNADLDNSSDSMSHRRPVAARDGANA